MVSGARERLVVNFHGIGEPWDGVPDDERPYWCPREEWPAFADVLAELARQNEVKLEITFDDGNLSDIEHGLPVLAERGLTATFHICAGRLGQPRYLAEEHLRELRSAGMGIGSHGWSHVDLRRIDPVELERESVGSGERLSAVIGAPVTHFALPFGSYDRRVLRSLRGYQTVYTSDRSRAALVGWLIPRMSYISGWEADDLLRFATERYALARRLRRSATTLAKRWR